MELPVGGLFDGVPVAREPVLAHQEVMEQLNCNPRESYGWARERLTTRVSSRGVARAKVDRFARHYVSSVELTVRLGEASGRITRVMRRLGLREYGGGCFWLRDQVRLRLGEIMALLPGSCRQLELGLPSICE